MLNKGKQDIWANPAVLIVAGLTLATVSVATYLNDSSKISILIVGAVGFVILVGGLISRKVSPKPKRSSRKRSRR